MRHDVANAVDSVQAISYLYRLGYLSIFEDKQLAEYLSKQGICIKKTSKSSIPSLELSKEIQEELLRRQSK